ncbi:hypothetical protein RIF29_03791 [Crotalaria pallida]|uniref:Uncharacterized protein n=1 Tax=Crotalaria pallida TaxID=3830 RepID=A0AAN9J1B6_CROPI
MMGQGALPGLSYVIGHHSLEPLPPPHPLENKIVAQEAKIERLAGDNHRLTSTHAELREALVAATQDAQKLKSHIRSTQTESDIQFRVLMDKIAKMEVNIKTDDSVKKDLRQANNIVKEGVVDLQFRTESNVKKEKVV